MLSFVTCLLALLSLPQGSPTVRDNIATVFGSKFLHTLDPVDVDLCKPVTTAGDAQQSGASAADNAWRAFGADEDGGPASAVGEGADAEEDADIPLTAPDSGSSGADGVMRLSGFISKAGKRWMVGWVLLSVPTHTRTPCCRLYFPLIGGVVVVLGSSQVLALPERTTTSSSCFSTAAPLTYQRFGMPAWGLSLLRPLRYACHQCPCVFVSSRKS